MKDSYKSNASFEMSSTEANKYHGTNETGEKGYYDEVRYTLKTPWRFIGSVAAVLAKSAILSFDYEYVDVQSMRVCDDNGDEYLSTTDNIKSYTRHNIFSASALNTALLLTGAFVPVIRCKSRQWWKKW